MIRTLRYITIVALISPILLTLIGCGATNVERKTTGGIGLGALAGGLISGDAGGAVAGEENGQKYVVDGKLSILDDTFAYVTPTYRVTGERIRWATVGN